MATYTAPLKFPLSDEQDYKGKITFSAYTDYVGTLQSIGLGTYQGVRDLATVAQAQGEQGIVDTATQIGRNAWETSRSIYDAFWGNDLTTVQTSAPATIERRGTVSLFLPVALQIADGIEYSNTQLDFRGAVVAGGLREAGQNASLSAAAQRYARTIGQDLESITDQLIGEGSGGAAAQLLALRVIRRASSQLQGAVETETGVALNPNRRTALSAPTIRRFTFQFKLIPNSPEESQAIKNIIKFFRVEMYPEAEGVISQQANVAAALRYPSKFRIGISYNNKKIATGILPCFLENVSIVYNPTGMAFHKDGEFQEIDMTLNFLEERPLSRQDVLLDYGEYREGFGTSFNIGGR